MRYLLPARLLLVAAAGVDLALAWQSVSGQPIAGCGGTEGCGQVLGTIWAHWLGIPVSLLALAVHLILLGLSFRPRFLETPAGRRCCITLIGSVWLAALWFVVLQAFVLHHFCLYCLTAHVFGAVAAGLLWLDLPKSRHGRGRGDVAGWALAFAGIVLLAGGQILFPTQAVAIHPAGRALTGTEKSPSSEQKKEEDIPRVQLALASGPMRAEDLPHLGKITGPLLVVLFDFTCPNCRKAHPALLEAVEKSNGQFGVVLLPVPIHPGCNRYIADLLPEHEAACEYARLALALWHRSPEDFHAFCARFMTNDPTPSAVEARTWAEERVGQETLTAALLDPWVDRQLQWNVEGFGEAVKRSGRAEMPKWIIGGTIISGAPSNASTISGWVTQYLLPH